MPAFQDITNQRFGRWTALRYLGRQWLCRCDCGKEKAVDGASLRDGRSTSCGCFRSEILRQAKTTHGMAKKGNVAPEWFVWQQMKQRCYNPKNSNWPNWGGRGITVCERWFHSFENFYADMGSRPSPKFTVERIDNDGPYSPENCRWATRTEQARNGRKNVYLDFRGERLTLTEWAERIGMKVGTLWQRLNQGWSIEKALTKPLQHS